ncbi:MAG: NB-ARC domain-containing protein, partial [Anaerolineales bacterium]|nr:NB-ARC domain-containing protein [Anaerolineales bacterium]
TCRRVLADELRVAPMPETTALSERIRAALETPRHNLPPLPTAFVGRAEELTEAIKLLNDPNCRLLTITGPGGIGKTRLALQIAAQQVESCLEGVCFVPLVGVSSPDLIVPAIADALGFSFSGAQPPRVQLYNYLRRKEMLLILDSCEHLLDGAELFGEILEHAPEVKLLVTSRARLNLRWEWRFEVEGLAYPKDESRKMKDENSSFILPPSSFEDYDAVQLFQQTARHADRRFALSAAEQPAVARICQMVEGMPLAIELAAASIGTRACAEIAREIEHGLSFLQTDLRDVPARHRSAQAAFEYSWRLLTPAEQRAFIAFSVFRRGGALEAAHHVTDAAPSVLDALVSKSLLRFLPTERYEMHELLRQYAAERLAALPEQETAARDKHCAHYAAFLQQREDALFGADAARVQTEVRAEMDNIRAAWDWAVTHARVEEIARGLNGLARFFDLVGPLQVGEMFIGEAVECVRALARQDTQVLLSRLLSERARFQSRMGMRDQIPVIAQEAIELASHANATCTMAIGHLVWGHALWCKGEYPAAQIQVEL